MLLWLIPITLVLHAFVIVSIVPPGVVLRSGLYVTSTRGVVLVQRADSLVMALDVFLPDLCVHAEEESADGIENVVLA